MVLSQHDRVLDHTADNQPVYFRRDLYMLATR